MTTESQVYNAYTKKQRSELKPTSLQQELRQKMRQRKKQGLTTDVTSEESEGLDDGFDSEEENSFTMQYRSSHRQRADRPTSAKRREKADLGDTMRPGDAERWLASNKQDHRNRLRETSPLNESPRFSKQNDLDKMFGTLGGSSPKSRTSPLDSRFGYDTPDAPIYGVKNRQSPNRQSPTTLPKGGGKQSPVSSQRDVESAIFGGRKTPTNEKPPPEKEWKAPSFRKSPIADRASPSFDRSGRKTPVDSGLQAISESPRPVPRSRQGGSPKESSLHSTKHSKLPGTDTLPRSLNMESPRMERSKPKVELFGKKERMVEFDDEDDQPMPSNRAARQRRGFMKDGRQPASRASPTSRTSPTLRASPTGRKTPERKEFGRKTPTNQNKTSTSGRKEEEEVKKGQPDLFDFLRDDDKKPSEKPQRSSRNDRSKSTERHVQLKKSVSHDSITEELEHPSMLEQSSKDDGKLAMDQSSVCFELDHDPNRTARMKEVESKQQSGKQRSDRKEADDIITQIENAQSDPRQITKERPKSAKTSSQIMKPKPRHTLPGTRPTSAADTTTDMFNSTISIRQAIYDEWKKAKTKELKEKTKQQKLEEENAKKKEEKDKLDKKLESKASYNAWMKQKEGTYVKEKQSQKRDEEMKKKEKEREELEKKKEAIKNFKKWKEVKDEQLIEQHKKKVEEKHRQKQSERVKKKEKEKDNMTAYRRWKERKDEKLVENHRKQHEEKLKTQKDIERTQEAKEREALRQYNQWLEKKEKQQQRQQHHSHLVDDEYKPAWSPASKVIPYGR